MYSENVLIKGSLSSSSSHPSLALFPLKILLVGTVRGKDHLLRSRIHAAKGGRTTIWMEA